MKTTMKMMLAVLMMSCTVFAGPPSPAELPYESVLTVYSRMFGQASKPIDPKLILIAAGGTNDSNDGQVAIFTVGKTVFVGISEGKGVAVVAVSGRENIIRLADVLAEAPIYLSKYGLGSVKSVPTCGKSELKIYVTEHVELSDYVYLTMASKIGNLGKIEVSVSPATAKWMSDALRHYIPLSGGVLEVNGELLMSAHTKVAGLLDDAKKLREQGERNDALKVLNAARAIISEAKQSVPKGDSVSLSNQEKDLGLEFTICVFAVGPGLTDADKAADKVAGINFVRRQVNEWGKEHGRPRTGDQDIRVFLRSVRQGITSVCRDGRFANDAKLQRRALSGLEEVERLEKLERSRPFERLVPADGSHPWVEIPLSTLESVKEAE